MEKISAFTALSPEVRRETCSEHGEFESRNLFGPVWSKCPVCAEAARAADEKKRVDAARLADVEHWKRRLKTSCIPDRFLSRSLDNFVAENAGQQKALDFSCAYVGKIDEVMATGRSVLFIGKPGTGKTHLAAGIGQRFVEASRSVLFLTVMRAVRRVKDTWAKGASESESEAVEALVFPDLLILDEVGVQFGSETEKLILFDVLNERYERRKPTILLSNLSVDGVRSFLGDRAFDRLREDGGKLICFDWESYRGRASGERSTLLDGVYVAPPNSVFAGAI